MLCFYLETGLFSPSQLIKHSWFDEPLSVSLDGEAPRNAGCFSHNSLVWPEYATCGQTVSTIAFSRATDSMSLDVTFLSGSSIILLLCQVAVGPVLFNGRAFNCGNVIEGDLELNLRFAAKHVKWATF